MRRLTRPRRDDRGAVSVVAALLMIPLLGFAAVAVDAAALYASKAQLQNGADAAALGIAQDCARRACGTPGTTAGTLARANTRDGNATTTVSPAGLTSATGRVTVTAGTTRTNLFAGLLGHPTTPVQATATARWGAPTGGPAVLPLAFSWCEWRWQTGGGYPSSTTPVTIVLTKTSTSSCTGPSGNVVPGGFGWVDTDAGVCRATSSVGQTLSSSTGNSPPGTCGPTSFSAQVGATVLLPIFDTYTGTGTGATYHVYAYAAFKLTGYYFAGQYDSGRPCSGNARCVRGYFTGLVSLDKAFTYSATAPDLGADVVALSP